MARSLRAAVYVLIVIWFIRRIFRKVLSRPVCKLKPGCIRKNTEGIYLKVGWTSRGNGGESYCTYFKFDDDKDGVVSPFISMLDCRMCGARMLAMASINTKLANDRIASTLGIEVLAMHFVVGYDITLHTLPPAELAPLISEEYEELGDEFERARGELYDMQHPPRTTK